jgi:hypothetical protein
MSRPDRTGAPCGFPTAAVGRAAVLSVPTDKYLLPDTVICI